MAGTSTPSPDSSQTDVPFKDQVYGIVARIPYGRATTYGAIARALGNPRGAREVGWALNAVPEGSQLPCHRVVDREGRLSGGWAFGHPEIMAGRLEDEGVPFLEQYRVDLSICFWDPAADDDSQQLGLF
jgi:methylated-DNA-protein-cysteine methyltransferase-like protein